jgi:hypothetical protein
MKKGPSQAPGMETQSILDYLLVSDFWLLFFFSGV